MRTHSRWPTVAVFFVVAFASGCVQSPNGESAETSSNGPTANVQSAPVMTVNQLMHGILFPLGNTVFFAQDDDPDALSRDPQPSTSPNPLTGLYGGWQAVENSALALAESADLLLIPGRTCSNGEVVNVDDADWIRFVDDLPREERGGVRGSSHEESGRDGRCERDSFGSLLGVPPRLSARADARRPDAALHSGPAGSASLSALVRSRKKTVGSCVL